MANTFQDQADERFDKATAFLNSSRMMLRNDLIYVSALADAVSAIKNMMQGYLYTQIALKPPGATPQSWQEAALGNSMPDLVRACADAGLRLPNQLGFQINQLNRERNQRTHDDPKRLINYTRAQEAIQVAEDVRLRVRAAMGIGVAPPKGAPAPIAAAAPVGPAARAPSTAAMPSATPGATVAPGAALGNAEGSDDLDKPDDETPPLQRTDGSRWRRFTRALGRVAAVALLLLVGIAAGVGVMIPVASGNAPTWLGFASRLLPTPAAARTATPAATVTATAAPTGPIILGAVTVSPPVCGAGGASFQLHNTGTAAAQWAVGSPGATAAMFALAAGDTPQMTLFGSLASASAVTIYASGHTPVVLTTDGGAVQLTLPAC